LSGNGHGQKGKNKRYAACDKAKATQVWVLQEAQVSLTEPIGQTQILQEELQFGDRRPGTGRPNLLVNIRGCRLSAGGGPLDFSHPLFAELDVVPLFGQT